MSPGADRSTRTTLVTPLHKVLVVESSGLSGHFWVQTSLCQGLLGDVGPATMYQTLKIHRKKVSEYWFKWCSWLGQSVLGLHDVIGRAGKVGISLQQEMDLGKEVPMNPQISILLGLLLRSPARMLWEALCCLPLFFPPFGLDCT